MAGPVGAALLAAALLAACGSSTSTSSPESTNSAVAVSTASAVASASSSASTPSGAPATTPTVAPITPAPAAAGTPSCAVVPLALIDRAYGDTVGAPTQTVNGPVAVCLYSGPKIGALLVRIAIGSTAARVAAERSQATVGGHPVVDVPGVLDQAFAVTASATSARITTLVARKGGTEVLVSTRGTLTQAEALVDGLAPSL